MLLLCAAFVGLTCASAAEDPLRAVLRSPRASLKLYSEFKEKSRLEYPQAENARRYRLFLDSASHVADYNEDKEDTGHYAINKFSVMSKEEKYGYNGLNVSSLIDEHIDMMEDDSDNGPKLLAATLGSESLPYQVLWTNSESVTVVRDQGSCGSCWAFATVGAVETRYKEISGVLRRFSEQEYLDCVYESAEGYNGCKGGGLMAPIYWSRDNGGRLAAEKDRKYEAMDKECRASSTPDAMIAAKIYGPNRVGSTEEEHLRALQSGSLASAIVATDKLFQYDGSIMKDTSEGCSASVNHAVTMVGYSNNYILIKNSWGDDWGDKGFARLARNHHNCKLYTYSYYPTLKKTSVKDSGPDQATDYRPTAEDNPTCSDEWPNCQPLVDNECCAACSSFPGDYWEEVRNKVATQKCRKTCGFCGSATCAGGTVECRDGVCRHEHMCT